MDRYQEHTRERKELLKHRSIGVPMILAVALAGIGACQATEETISVTMVTTERTHELQKITMLSSMQFYTHFALIRNMLKGDWDEERFKQFSLYDGLNLQMMRRYEEQLKGDKKWGPFLKMKNSLHTRVYDDIEPLIRKKRKNEKLTDADLKTLKTLDKLILDKLIK